MERKYSNKGVGGRSWRLCELGLSFLVLYRLISVSSLTRSTHPSLSERDLRPRRTAMQIEWAKFNNRLRHRDLALRPAFQSIVPRLSFGPQFLASMLIRHETLVIPEDPSSECPTISHLRVLSTAFLKVYGWDIARHWRPSSLISNVARLRRFSDDYSNS